jgi:hypothetical protein
MLALYEYRNEECGWEFILKTTNFDKNSMDTDFNILLTGMKW